jgi:hypothetical protein
VLRKQDERLVEAFGSVVLEPWDLHEQGPRAATRGPLDSATPVSALRPEACAWVNVSLSDDGRDFAVVRERGAGRGVTREPRPSAPLSMTTLATPSANEPHTELMRSALCRSTHITATERRCPCRCDRTPNEASVYPDAGCHAYRSTARSLGGIVGWPMAATTLCE